MSANEPLPRYLRDKLDTLYGWTGVRASREDVESAIRRYVGEQVYAAVTEAAAVCTAVTGHHVHKEPKR